MTYHVFNTENGALFASRSFEASLQDEQEADNEEFLREPVEMYREIVDSFIPQMMKQLAPYTVRESRRLMKDKSKDPLMERVPGSMQKTVCTIVHSSCISKPGTARETLPRDSTGQSCTR
ncbi:MAG: hypothetical protein KAS61_07490 [Spirochaetes bacterium]|nr:hypothetical protein [Spirochaetota bacterium]